MMTPEERISKLANSWAGQTYLLCHDDLVNLIREVQRDTLAMAIKQVEASWDYPYADCIKDMLEKQ